MATTKVIESSDAAATAPSAAPTEDAAAREESSEVAKLKTLNQILLKETREQREKVSDLQSRLDLLSIHKAISDDIERGVTSIVFASCLAELAGMKAVAEVRVWSAEADLVLERSQMESLNWEKDAVKNALDAAVLEKDAARRDLDEAKQQAEVIESALRKETDSLVFDLEQKEETIRSLEADKARMEEIISSIEESLSNTSEKLQSVAGQKAEMGKHLERAIQEREACKRDLDRVTTELQMVTAELKMSTVKMNSSLAECAAFKEGIAKMQQEFNGEKSKFDRDMDAMMKTVSNIQCEKEDLEKQKMVLEAKISILQETVTKLEAIVQEKESLEEELRTIARALSVANQSLESVTGEKDDAKRALDQAIFERELSQRKLAEEEEWKAVATKVIERLKVQCDSLEKSNVILQNENEKQKIDYACELDGLRESLRKTIEKYSLRELTDEQCFEITYLHGQVEYLLSTAVLLDAEMEDTKKLKMRIEELEKNWNDAHKGLQKIKASLDKLIAEVKSIILEEKLGNNPQVVEEVEQKIIAVDRNSKEILSQSRSTSDSKAAINGVEQGHEDGVEQEIIVVEEGSDETMKDIAGKLEVMKAVIRSSAQMIKAREEELEELRGALKEASKKRRAWCGPWVYPTSCTLLAAIALAVVAKH